MSGTPRPLVVLESFPEPQPTTNPYVVMLLNALRTTEGLTPLTFTWRRALTAHYDVFHVHWPEILVHRGSGWKRLVRQLLFALLLCRLRFRRVPVVRTQHNLRPHEGLGRRASSLLRCLDRRVNLMISLNRVEPATFGPPVRQIVHGDYREWYAPLTLPPREPNRLGFFGLIRPYKGVEELVEAFGHTTGPLELAVAGRPQDGDLGESIRAAAGRDKRISLKLRFLSDEELVDHVGRCVLIVLPYRDALNSGGALAALSLGRPVLMPDNAANRALAQEVGLDWVRLYDGRLTPELLEAEATRAGELTGRPDLTERRWQEVGRRHRDAFEEALERCRGLVP